MPKKIDPEVAEFEAALLRSADQAVAGRHARVHTPEQISARRRGRPWAKRRTPRRWKR